MVIHETFPDFVLFLYIHMAYIDGEYHIEEEKAILDKIPKLFPIEGDPKRKLNNALSLYKSVDPVAVNDIIHDTFKHFDQITFSQRYKIYTNMFDIVYADGKIDESEEKALKELKDIINVGGEARRR